MDENIKKINKLLIDWFSCTVHDLTVDEVFTILGIDEIKDNFEIVNGYNGYKDRYFYENMSIYFNGHEDQGINISFSGQGCRAWETYSTYDTWDELFREVLSFEKTHICRVDFAYDDFENLLPMDKIGESVRLCNWSSPSNLCTAEYQLKFRKGRPPGLICYLGSEFSNIMFRIYDKAVERNVDYQWTRFEIQMRDNIAEMFVLQYLDTDSTKTFSDLFFGIINSYIRFIEPSSARKSRCPNAKWWDDFLEHGNKIKLYSDLGIEYNVSRLENYILNQCGNALQTYINLFGFSYLMSELDKNHKIKDLPLKYKTLITRHLRPIQARTVERKLPVGDVTFDDKGNVICDDYIEFEEIKELPERIINLMNELNLDELSIEGD